MSQLIQAAKDWVDLGQVGTGLVDFLFHVCTPSSDENAASQASAWSEPPDSPPLSVNTSIYDTSQITAEVERRLVLRHLASAHPTPIPTNLLPASCPQQPDPAPSEAVPSTEAATETPSAPVAPSNSADITSNSPTGRRLLLPPDAFADQDRIIYQGQGPPITVRDLALYIQRGETSTANINETISHPFSSQRSLGAISIPGPLRPLEQSPFRTFISAFGHQMLMKLGQRSVHRLYGLKMLAFLQSWKLLFKFFGHIANAWCVWTWLLKLPKQVVNWYKDRFMRVAVIPPHEHLLKTSALEWLRSNRAVKYSDLSFRDKVKLSVMTAILVEDGRRVVARSCMYDEGCGQGGWDDDNYDRYDRDGSEEDFSLEFDDEVYFHKPESESQVFVHNNNLFIFTRSKLGELEFWCGTSTHEPLRDLFRDIRKLEQRSGRVRVFTFKGNTSLGWEHMTTRLPRSIEHVYMDDAIRMGIINDITDYYTTARQWSETRGIPWRMGYEFYGQPGCGKTTLAFALAGHFQLDIYVLPLTAPKLDDTMLMKLVSKLKPGCMLLLEDIDSAGLGREVATSIQESLTMKTDSESPKPGQKGDNGKEVPSGGVVGGVPPDKSQLEDARPSIASSSNSKNEGDAARKVRDAENKPAGSVDAKTTSITLSGMLNALDGVAAPTGHLVVMTTNHPENIDPALTRSGRINKHIEFGLVTRPIAEQMFNKMYEHDPGPLNRPAPYDTESVPALAKAFADKLPEGKLSPAALQDFIVDRKTEPDRAAREIEEWARRHLHETQLKQELRDQQKLRGPSIPGWLATNRTQSFNSSADSGVFSGTAAGSSAASNSGSHPA